MAGIKNPFSDWFGTLTYDGKTDDANARGYLDQSTGAFDGLGVPDLQPLTLEDILYEGDVNGVTAPRNVNRGPDVSYNPITGQTASLALQGDSALKDYAGDPALRDNQMKSLAALQAIGDGNGMTAEDSALINKMRNSASRDAMGRNGAILQGMHARGQGGTGNELMAQMMNAQAATDRESQTGMDVAAQAQARKLAAIQGVGAQSGALRDQDFGEASRKAAVQDAINNYNTSARNRNSEYNTGILNDTARFNTSNALDTSRYNSDKNFRADMFDVGNQFDADKFNVGVQSSNRDARQGVTNANTDIHNKARIYNTSLPQQQWENRYKVAAGRSGAAQAGVDYYGKKYAAGQAGKGNMFGGLASLGAAAMMASDERVKKNVSDLSDDDIDEFLAALEPKKFSYKDPEAHGEGKRAGVMAQDVEKSKLGKMIVVEDEDGTKGLDKEKSLSLMLAALGSLSKRLVK